MKTVRAINTGRSSTRPKKQTSHQRQKASTSNNGPESLVNQSDDSSEESGGAVADSRPGSSVQGKLPKTRTVQGIKILGNVRSYDGNCNENVTLKLNFALSLVSCGYSMLITLYKIGELHVCLLDTNGFHVKTKSERFAAASSRCRQNLKYENFMSSFGRLRQNIAPKSVPHVLHDYFSSFNQSNH